MTGAPSLPREFAPGIFQVGSCTKTDLLADGVIHVHSSAYLVRGTKAALLVDSCQPRYWRQLSAQLDVLLGDRPLDWLVPTHTEVPHAGNVHRLCAKYPTARVIGDTRDYHLLFPQVADRLDSRPAGSEIDLGGGYKVTLLDAIIKDMDSTQWAYEASQQVLFVSDGFAYSHHPPVMVGDEEQLVHQSDECALMSGELPVPPQPEQMAYITKNALFWTRYVKIAPYLERFAALVDRHPTKFIAPAHGNVVNNLEAIMPMVREAHRLAFVGSAPGGGKS